MMRRPRATTALAGHFTRRHWTLPFVVELLRGHDDGFDVCYHPIAWIVEGASRAKVVGGVVIKTESLGVETWIDALARGLAAYAASSAGARAALERLVM